MQNNSVTNSQVYRNSDRLEHFSSRTFNQTSDDKTSSPLFIKEIDTNRLTVQKSAQENDHI